MLLITDTSSRPNEHSELVIQNTSFLFQRMHVKMVSTKCRFQYVSHYKTKAVFIKVPYRWNYCAGTLFYSSTQIARFVRPTWDPAGSMGPGWVLSASAGPHVGPMNLVIREVMLLLNGWVHVDESAGGWSVIDFCGLCNMGYHLNSLGPSDSMWRWRSWSTLVQLMSCCLTAPSHYLNQCWLIISQVMWHSSEDT